MINSIKLKVKLKRQIYSLYRQLQGALTVTSIRVILVKLYVSRLQRSPTAPSFFHCTPLSVGRPAANQSRGRHVSEMCCAAWLHLRPLRTKNVEFIDYQIADRKQMLALAKR
jgi:hypothetical protein